MFICKSCNCCKGISDKVKTELCCELSLVAVRSRLDLLLWLAEGKHCVCDLASHTNLSQSLISHHLADLTKGGLIEGKKDGKFNEYKLTSKGEKLIKSIKYLMSEGGEKDGML